MIKKLGIFTCFLFFFACEKETVVAPTEVWMTYDMTQCSDPWYKDSGALSVADALKAYLEKQNVKDTTIKIIKDETKVALCLACTCSSGEVANVLVKASDVVTMETLKFVKK